MLAPRKTLWSTPISAINHIESWIPQLRDGVDCICDIGCGDGRILLEWSKRYSTKLFQQQEEERREMGPSSNKNNDDTPKPITPTPTPPLQEEEEGVDINQRRGSGTTTTKTTISFIGIDIDSDRIQQCKKSLQEAKSEGLIHPNISIEFHCGNALELLPTVANKATIFFLYLIPRGLKVIKPFLLEHKERLRQQQQQNQQQQQKKEEDAVKEDEDEVEKFELRVITYMSPLPGEERKHVARELCHVEHQPEAAWPLYFYHL